MISRREFMVQTAGSAAALLLPASPLAAQDSLDDAILKACREELQKRKEDTTSLALEPLQPDLKVYDALVRGSPEAPRQLSQKYRTAAERIWYGFAKTKNRVYAGLYDRPTQKLEWLEPVDEGEQKFIRMMLDLGSIKPQKLDIPASALKQIEDDPWGRYDNIVASAKSDKTYGKHADEELVKLARAALEHAGDNSVNFLKAMSAMSPTEQVLALNLLPHMVHKAYGFGNIHDLTHQKASVFHENVAVAAQALKDYSWAREEAAADWINFMQGVVVPRFSGEYDFGGRRHLSNATKELVKDCKTLEQAVQRIVGSFHKLARYNPGYDSADGNWLNYTIAHRDRCEAMAMLGSLLMRTAGIPNFQAFTPWWADGDGNHAWNVVHSAKNSMIYSFLTGDKIEWEGKPNIHHYDLFNPAIPQTDVGGKRLKGMPGVAKVFFLSFARDAPRNYDLTQQCTATTTVRHKVGDGVKEASLLVYNGNIFEKTGAFREVWKVRPKGDTAVFENVGCIPRTYEVDGKPVVSDGLIYQIRTEKGATLPFVLAPDGSKTFLKLLYEQADVQNVAGFAPGFKCGVYALVKTKDNKIALNHLGEFAANEKGELPLPVAENQLIFIAQGNRPWTVRKVDGKLRAYRH